MYNTINQRLKNLLVENNFSNKVLYDHLGVTKQSVSNWIQGRQKIPSKYHQKILELFPNINFEWFITGIGGKYINSNTDQDKLCEECLKKNAIIEKLEFDNRKLTEELKGLYIEIGKYQERLNKQKK